MKTSTKVDQIAIALSKAQAVMEGADRSSTNPFFHSKYAQLSEVWDACRKPLTDNGLSFIQSIGSEQGYSFTAKTPTKDNPSKESLFIWLTVTSRLQHISEQYYEDSISLPVEADPQSIGKVTTYCRRYAQMALCGIATIDDDGNEASGKIIPKPVNVNHNVPIVKNPAPTTSKESTTPPEGKQEAIEQDVKTEGHAELITEPQIRKIFASAKQMNYTEPAIKEIMTRHFHKESTKQLSKTEASEFIEAIAAGKHIKESGEWA